MQRVNDRLIVASENVVIGKEIPEDEIDLLSTGFIVMPKCIKYPTPEPSESEPSEPPEELPEPEKKIHNFRYSFKVNRQQLFKCFDALGNLAEKSGEISITVDAKSEEGIDHNWLRNAVEEPIEEVGIKIIREKINE